jgi:hypothetical protein
MADEENDYKVGPGRPPLHTRLRKEQSGNPGGRRPEAPQRPGCAQYASRTLDMAVTGTERR